MIITDRHLDVLSELWKCHAGQGSYDGQSFELETGHKTVFCDGSFWRVLTHFQEKSGATVTVNGTPLADVRQFPENGKLLLGVLHRKPDLKKLSRNRALLYDHRRSHSRHPHPEGFVGRMGIVDFHITYEGICLFVIQDLDPGEWSEGRLQEYLSVLSQKTNRQCEFVFADVWAYDDYDGEIMQDQAAIVLMNHGYAVPKDLIINCNDAFGPGSDAEVISQSEIVKVFKCFVVDGYKGIVDYVREKREAAKKGTIK